MRHIVNQATKILYLSWPVLLAKIGIPIRGLIVTWIFAKLSLDNLAAGALGDTLLMTMLTFFLGVLMSSAGVMTSHAIGSNEQQNVKHILQQGVWLGFFLSIFAMLFLFYIKPILLLLGQEQHIVMLTTQFTDGLLWVFFPFTIVTTSVKLLVNLKKTYTAMCYSFLGLITTIVISYLLALRQWHFPQLGIKGVGFGITAGYTLQMIVMLIHFYSSKSLKQYNYFSNIQLPKLAHLKEYWCMGWPIGIKYNLEFLLFFTLAAIIGSQSAQDLAVFQVALQIVIVTAYLSSGIGLTGGILLGQALGAKKTKMIISTCYAALLVGLFYVGTISLLLLLFPEMLITFFFNSTSYEFDLLLSLVNLIIVFQLLDNLKRVMTDLLIITKDSRFLLKLDIFVLWIVSLLSCYLLGIKANYGLQGILIGLIVGSVITVIFMSLRLRRQLIIEVSSSILAKTVNYSFF